jgi:hypothetical protein
VINLEDTKFLTNQVFSALSMSPDQNSAMLSTDPWLLGWQFFTSPVLEWKAVKSLTTESCFLNIGCAEQPSATRLFVPPPLSRTWEEGGEEQILDLNEDSPFRGLIQGRNIRYSIQIYKDVSEIYKDASTQQTSGEFIFGMS